MNKIKSSSKTPEDITAYLDAAMHQDDPDFFLTAMGDVIKAVGTKQVAKSMGHGEKSLYKSIN